MNFRLLALTALVAVPLAFATNMHGASAETTAGDTNRDNETGFFHTVVSGVDAPDNAESTTSSLSRKFSDAGNMIQSIIVGSREELGL